MKVIKLLILPIFLFSFELNFDKKFQHELPHDSLTTTVKITIEDDTELLVAERLDMFNQKIKNFDKVNKSFGTLNIRPKYRNSMNTPKIIAYIGELRYKVDSNKARYMHEFISELTTLKRNRDTSVSLNNLSWTVTEDAYNVSLDLLRLRAINWGLNYIKNISVDLNKECLLKSVSIDKMSQYARPRTSNLNSSRSIENKSISIPESNQEKIVIFANFVMECK